MWPVTDVGLFDLHMSGVTTLVARGNEVTLKFALMIFVTFTCLIIIDSYTDVHTIRVIKKGRVFLPYPFPHSVR